jgi:DNA-binding NarL/FixJ family response regulator
MDAPNDTPAGSLRVVLVDDHELVRRGVAAVLAAEDDLEVAGQFGDGAEAVAACESLRPDVVVMDLRMPGTSGIEATAALRERLPGTGVLVLTVSEQASDLQEALRVGAQGYVLKGATPDELVRAVRQVALGWAVISPAMAGKLLADFPASTAADDGADDLSGREWDVLSLLADGLSNREIADRLVLSENTVKTHMRAILTKLHLKNRIQAAAYARRAQRTG